MDQWTWNDQTKQSPARCQCNSVNLEEDQQMFWENEMGSFIEQCQIRSYEAQNFAILPVLGLIYLKLNLKDRLLSLTMKCVSWLALHMQHLELPTSWFSALLSLCSLSWRFPVKFKNHTFFKTSPHSTALIYSKEDGTMLSHKAPKFPDHHLLQKATHEHIGGLFLWLGRHINTEGMLLLTQI